MKNLLQSLNRYRIKAFLTALTLLCASFYTMAQDEKILNSVKGYEEKAVAAYEKGDVSDAYSYYNYALWMLKDKYSKSERLTGEYLRCLIKVSSLAFENGELDDAKEFLADAQEVAEIKYDKMDVELGAVYKRVGDVYLEEDDCNVALDYYEKAFHIYHKKEKLYKSEVAAILYKKAYILNHYKHEMAKALKECNKAIDLGVSAKGDHPEIGDYFSECGLIEYVQGHYNASYNYFMNALAIKEHYLGHEDKEVGKAYEEIGAVNWELHKYDSALSSYEQARDIYNHVYPGVKAHVEALNYKDRSVVYVAIDDSTGEEYETMKDDLDINKMTLDVKNKKLALTYRRMAKSYLKIGKPQNAVNAYEQSIEIYEDVAPEGSIEYADIIEELAQAYEQNGQSKKSKKSYAECASMREDVLGPDDPKTIDARNKANYVRPSRER